MCGRRRWASTWCSSRSVRADRRRTAPRRVLLYVGGGGRERWAVLPGKCGRHGAEVRGGLTRAAERVRRVAEAPAEGIDETRPPPAPEDANNPVAVGARGERERRVVTHPFLEHDGPLAIAHRGGALDGRENSMAAFARAVELGYRYLETDVHVTAADVLVVFHDDRLDRVTDRTGEIGSLTWREVRAASAGRTPIPLFADVLVSWPNVRVNVDPKSDRAVGPLVRTIRAAGALDRVCSARSRTAACGGHGPRWGHGCALPWGRARSSGYAWPPGDCYPAARCQVPRPARRFLYDAGSSPSPSNSCFTAPTSSAYRSTSGR
jgi:hypothetical protein